MMLSRFLRDQNGATAILASILMPVVAAAAGMSIDYALLSAEKVKLQATADGAVFAASRSLFQSYGQPTSAREATAMAEAAGIIKNAGSGVQSEITVLASTNMVAVKLWEDKALVFGGLFGYRNSTVRVSASGTYKDPQQPGCVIALGSNESIGVDLNASSVLRATNCTVQSNSTSASSISVDGEATLQAKTICAVGSVSGRGTLTPTPQSLCKPLPDPFAGRSLANSAPCTYTSQNLASSGTTVYLDPGVYCGGLTINSVQVVMRPGLYEFRDGPLSIPWSQKSIQADGVTWLFTGTNAYLDVGWTSGSITLSAPTSGNFSGIAIAARTSATLPLTSKLNSQGTTTIAGSIYLPTQRLVISESGTTTLTGQQDKVVALSLSMQHNTSSPTLVVNAVESEQSSSSGDIRLTQ